MDFRYYLAQDSPLSNWRAAAHSITSSLLWARSPRITQSFWATSTKKKGYSGVATYCSIDRLPVAACEIDSLGTGSSSEENASEESASGEGRYLLTDFGVFVLINVYVPNAGERPARPRLASKLRFLEALLNRCRALVSGGRQVLLVGDLNVACDPEAVHPKIGTLNEVYTEEERRVFKELTDLLSDVWRATHPDATAAFTCCGFSFEFFIP